MYFDEKLISLYITRTILIFISIITSEAYIFQPIRLRSLRSYNDKVFILLYL